MGKGGAMDRAIPSGRATAASQSNPQAVSSKAGVPIAAVTERTGEAILFTIRDGWEWGNIYVRPLGEGAEVVAHSSFGTFGYVWIAMGGDWREFLSSCDRYYAMNKLAGRAYEVPLDRAEFVAAMQAAVNEYEKCLLEAWGIADSDTRRQIDACRETLNDEWCWEDVPPEALFWHFNEQASGAPYALELYETRLTKINPQVVGFWDTIWTPFATFLAQAGVTRTGGDAQAGSVAEGDSTRSSLEDAPKDTPND